MGVADDFAACVRGGGVAVFPADTVYGLACAPGDAAVIARMYALKGRAPEKRSALMVLGAPLPPLPPRTAAAIAALTPGPLTFVVAELGLRIPDLPLLAGAGVVVLQTSANLAGGPDARRLEDVPEEIRAGADLVIDGGELPGVASTVVDLSAYEDGGGWSVLRDGAVDRDRLAAVLGGSPA